MIISAWSPFRADERCRAGDRRRCRNDRFSVHFRLRKLEKNCDQRNWGINAALARGESFAINARQYNPAKRRVLITFCLELRENYLNGRPTIFAHRSFPVPHLPAGKARRFNYARENSRLIALFIPRRMYQRRSRPVRCELLNIICENRNTLQCNNMLTNAIYKVYSDCVSLDSR